MENPLKRALLLHEPMHHKEVSCVQGANNAGKLLDDRLLDRLLDIAEDERGLVINVQSKLYGIPMLCTPENKVRFHDAT